MFRKDGSCRRFDWMLLGIGLPMLLSCLAVQETALYGQRILCTIDPKAQSLDLKFEINSDPTDNIAPNIVFNSTGTRGMVSYTGSGTVVAFNPQDGTIAATVKTGGRPSQLAMAPDSSLLLAVNVISNQIFAIDPSSFTLKATYAFADAEFGFGNNIVFSADGKSGYISTFRYDSKFTIPIEGELIRFNVADGKESGTRIKVGIAPTVITLSPNKKTIAVVNADMVHATAIVETISLVDTDSFSVRNTVKLDAGADLTFLNNVTFSKDSSVAIVANRGLQSQLLSNDISYVIQVSDGTILARPDAGIAPTMSTISPDGKYFYLLNEFGYNIIDTTTYAVVQSIQSPYSEFISNTNLVFKSDSSMGYVASQDTDVVLGIRPANGGIISALFLSPNGADMGTKQTMQVALTPDGRIVCAVNFKANTVQCGVDTYDLAMPGLEVSDYNFSGFSIINTSGQKISASIMVQDLNSTTIANDETGLASGQDQTVALTGTGRLAQSFQVIGDSSIDLIRLYLKKTGSFGSSARLQATIQTNSSSAPSGTVVGELTASIAADSVGTSLGYAAFRFPQKLSLTATTTYWIVIEGAGSYGSEYTASSKIIEWGVAGSAPPYTNGQFSVYASSWTADANKDALFVIVLSEVDNPRSIDFGPGQQLVGTQEFFKLNDQERNGRFLVQADKPGLQGYWVTGSRDLARMDGALPDSKGYSDLLIPEVIQVADLVSGYTQEQDGDATLAGSSRLAQSFQLDKSAQISLLRLYLRKTGSFTESATLRVSIQEDASGSPSGTALTNASLEFAADTISLVYTYIPVRFAEPASLDPGKSYWIVLEGTGTYSTEYAETSKLIDWGVDATSPGYSLGKFAVFSTNWVADAEKDALFSVVLAEQYNLNTRFNIINRYYNFSSVSYELYDSAGNQEQQASSSLPGLVRLMQGMDLLFPSAAITDRQGGYLRIRGAGEINAFAQIGTETSQAILPAITLDEAAFANKKLFYPRVIAGPDIDSVVNVINLVRESGYTTGQDAVEALTGSGKLAQSFQLDQTGNISLIRILLKKTGTFAAEAKLKAGIQADSGGAPSGTPLSGAAAEFTAESVNTSLAVTSLRFDVPIALQKGTTYWLVLEGAGTYSTEYAATTKVIEWGVDATSPTYLDGQFTVFADGKWTADATKDALFEVALSEDNEVTLSLYGSTGTLLVPPLKKNLPSGGQLRELLSNLFPSLNYAKGIEGWIQVDSAKPGIVGDVLFLNPNVDFLSGGLMQMVPLTDILFAQVAQGAGFETGWLLLNPAELPADVTIELHDTTGATRASRTLRLNGRNSLDLAFTDVFTNISELVGGYAVVHSTQPLYSMSLFTNTDLTFVCAIPPQPYR